MKAAEYKKEAKKLDKPSIKEVIKSLQEQKAAHEKQYLYHKVQSIKAEGAIEILQQLDDSEE